MAAAESRARRIREILVRELNPSACEVTDDSAQHSGHAGARKAAAQGHVVETHFSLRIVADCFAGLPPVRRHQLVYDLLRAEFASGLHALAMTTLTPEEAQAKK